MLNLALRLSALRLWRGKFAFCCQVCALAAVMAPLLIILGLKHGVLTSMRENLLSNPNALEVWFIYEELREADIEEVRQYPETAFALPRLHSLYAFVSLVPEGQQAGHEIYKLESTAKGDPLLARAGIPSPGERELVLSTPMANEIGVKAGDAVTLTTSRNNKREFLTRSCRVSHVLPLELNREKCIYVPHALGMEVEIFVKQGQGTPGDPAMLDGECYAGLVIAGGTDKQQNIAAERLAISEANRAELPVVQANAQNFPTLPAGTRLLYREGRGLTAVDAMELNEQAMQEEVVALPWSPPVAATLRGKKTEFSVTLHSRLEPPLGDYALCQAPEKDVVELRRGPVLELPAEQVAALGGGEAELCIATPNGESRITCQLVANAELKAGQAYTNPQFAALCRQATRIPTRWNYHEGAVHYPVVTHFTSMRLYARGLEDVEPLCDKLRRKGLKPMANLKIIRELLALEHAINTLYLLISCGAAVGAVFSVALSLFSSVENNRRHYAQLLIMGMKRLPLAAVPLFEGCLTTLAAFGVSLGIFKGVSNAADQAFAAALSQGNRLCVLLPEHGLLFLGAALCVAAVAAVAATIRILRISPSESLREL